jgi:hypothetical protein
MGYRDYMRANCPEAVYGDESDEESENLHLGNDSLKDTDVWEYSSNGYCENCKAIVYEDKGRCPECNKFTKNKYHWHLNIKVRE